MIRYNFYLTSTELNQTTLIKWLIISGAISRYRPILKKKNFHRFIEYLLAIKKLTCNKKFKDLQDWESILTNLLLQLGLIRFWSSKNFFAKIIFFLLLCASKSYCFLTFVIVNTLFSCDHFILSSFSCLSLTTIV